MNTLKNPHAVKIFPWVLAGLVLVCLPATVRAEIKVGFVNIAKVMQQSPQANDARLRIQKEFEPRDRDLLARQRAVRALEDKLVKNAAVMSSSERDKQEQDLNEKKRSLLRAQSDFRDDLNMRRNEELSKLQRLVVSVIQSLAKADKYDLVVSEGVVYAGPRVDITNKVIARLKAKFKSSH